MVSEIEKKLFLARTKKLNLTETFNLDKEEDVSFSKEQLGIQNEKNQDSEMQYRDMDNGYRLYWKSNEVGGRTYFSDEIGGGVFVWDTSLCSDKTLLFALRLEKELSEAE